MPQDKKKKIRTGLLHSGKALGPRASLELGLHSIGTHWSPHSNEAHGQGLYPTPSPFLVRPLKGYIEPLVKFKFGLGHPQFSLRMVYL